MSNVCRTKSIFLDVLAPFEDKLYGDVSNLKLTTVDI